MILNKDQILAADDLKREEVECPEWGGSVLISTLTAADRDGYELSIVKMDRSGNSMQDFSNMRAKLVARCLVDGEGKRLFEDNEVIELGKKSSRALDRCYSVASRLNAVSEDDLEELAKNS